MLLPRPALSLSTRTVCAKQLVYSEYGDPAKVLRLQTISLPDNPPAGRVHVKWLAAPVHPADVNTLQGVYPTKPPLPAVAGIEGFGRVEKVGDGVRSLRVGDHVVPARVGLGVWRSDGYHRETDLVAIDTTLSLEASATFQINPPTAYRMLKDFVDLKPGDTVMQNGANSAVGRAVIQMCRIWGIRTVNILRKRSNLRDVINELKTLGADEVLTYEELSKECRGKYKDIRLALNCVGGRSTISLASALGSRGCMVTYGGMSRQPIQVPTGPLIFKDVRLVGFWITPWYEDPKNEEERSRMYNELTGWMKSGEFVTPSFEKRQLEDHSEVLQAATVEFDKKQLFIL